MISLEGRIARIETVLAVIFDKLPKFIKEPLGEEVQHTIEDMKREALETLRLGREKQ